MDNTPTKTAMMELIELLEKSKRTSITDTRFNALSFAIQEARTHLEKEKTQIVDAFQNGHDRPVDNDDCYIDGQEYFNQTYKQ